MNTPSGSNLFNYYNESPLTSHKWESYFDIYEELLNEYKNQNITFVEVGVHNGGSLFMWKKFFGKNSRIIGIDLNPNAKELEQYGFEIFIGSQGDSNFWTDFYKEIGDIDILLDDGSHNYYDQLLTLQNSISNIRDNGLIIVEDTHTSFMKKFGYKTTKTFVDFTPRILLNMHKKHPYTEIPKEKSIYDSIYKISNYESITAFHINKNFDRVNIPTMNHGKGIGSTDFRNTDKWVGKLLVVIDNFQNYLYLKKRSLFIKILLRLNSYFSKLIHWCYNLTNRKKINKFFNIK